MEPLLQRESILSLGPGQYGPFLCPLTLLSLLQSNTFLTFISGDAHQMYSAVPTAGRRGRGQTWSVKAFIYHGAPRGGG